MLKNYLKIALRNLRRSPGYAALNILGLALGLAACLLIGLYVQDERSYDRYHANYDRIYRVSQRVVQPEGDQLLAWTGGQMAPLLEQDFSVFEAVVRIHRAGAPISYVDAADAARSRAFREEDMLFADEDFFEVFTFEAVQGNLATALVGPGAVVLTRSAARRYFGEEDALGKTLLYDGRVPLRVTAVVEDVPTNSHFTFDLVGSMAALKQVLSFPTEAEFGSFWWPFMWTYALLPEGVSAAEIEPQLQPFIARHREDTQYVPTLEALSDLYLSSTAESTPEPTGSLATVRTFLLIALAVLLLACINFMNLATARSARRAREVGVRKVAGAARRQLVAQFLGESVLLSVLALGLAIGLVELLLPAFNTFTARELVVGYGENSAFWLGLLALVVLTGVLGGAYPAFYLSGFRPAHVLKSSTRVQGGYAWLRKGLVVFQFSVSTALIVGTLVAFGQLRFMQEARLGFDKEQVVAIRLDDTDSWDALADAFRARPEVLEVTAARTRPGLGTGGDLPVQAEGVSFEEDEEYRIHTDNVEYGYFEMLGLEMVAGRSFSADYPSDLGVRADDSFFAHYNERGMIINEAAARWLGWTPEEALGKAMRYYAFENGIYFTDIRGTVVGVVEDHHKTSLHGAIEPVVYTLARTPSGFYASWALVKVAPGQAAATLAALEGTWDALRPLAPFTASFLDADLAALYVREARLSKIIGAFALLGLIIACLGLFGLAAYAAERRTKEIGIRKVMGASVPGLVGLLSREFLVLVGVAALVAMPLAYLGMRHWLDGFAYRIELSWMLFAAAGLGALMIAFVTVSYQALRAAYADPVESLRYE